MRALKSIGPTTTMFCFVLLESNICCFGKRKEEASFANVVHLASAEANPKRNLKSSSCAWIGFQMALCCAVLRMDNF